MEGLYIAPACPSRTDALYASTSKDYPNNTTMKLGCSSTGDHRPTNLAKSLRSSLKLLESQGSSARRASCSSKGSAGTHARTQTRNTNKTRHAHLKANVRANVRANANMRANATKCWCPACASADNSRRDGLTGQLRR